MIHKIHYGSSLANGYQIIGNNNSVHDFSTVTFTKDIDDCTVCHRAALDSGNWNMVPSMQACGACHDNVNFATGANHGVAASRPATSTARLPSVLRRHPPPGGIPSRSRPCTAARRGATRARSTRAAPTAS